MTSDIPSPESIMYGNYNLSSKLTWHLKLKYKRSVPPPNAPFWDAGKFIIRILYYIKKNNLK